jgi:hypothetical protein
MNKRNAIKAKKRQPVRRYTVRVYEEKTAQQLERLAENEGYREMCEFFVDGRLRSSVGGLSPFQMQALEVLGFQLECQSNIVAQALAFSKRDKNAKVDSVLLEQAEESKEALSLVMAILGDDALRAKRRKRS